MASRNRAVAAIAVFSLCSKFEVANGLSVPSTLNIRNVNPSRLAGNAHKLEMVSFSRSRRMQIPARVSSFEV